LPYLRWKSGAVEADVLPTVLDLSAASGLV
jgi:hypothetical protein